MTKSVRLNRWQLLMLASASLVAAPIRGIAAQDSIDIHVVKDPQCGCCNAWIKILNKEGFNVTIEDRGGQRLTGFKIENGIPENMMSCHTAKVGKYFIEGHVPAQDIKSLMKKRPTALGITVPGMRYGAPGTGPGEKRDAYDVFIIGPNGGVEVFQHYPKAGIPI